ncbi:type II secretion system protein [Kiritimatiellota bacterium B12222]|nr:type II secretion system protein [Kiritimatiellota bacterium B12222]
MILRKMRFKRTSLQGFTLIELMITMSIFSLVVTGVLLGWANILRREHVLSNRMAMISDGQRLASFLRKTTRLSRINEMVMYPQESPHIAISYPIPEGQFDSENEYILEDGTLVWGHTLIVHAWPADDPQELRLTSFSPRDTTLSALEREQQLEDVTLNGSGANTFNGQNSDTRTLAKLQPEFSFRPDGGTYNFYSATSMRDKNVVMGGVRLQPGTNTITFRAKSKSSGSTGFGMKIDKLYISPAGLAIEGESLLPVTAQSGATAVAEENLLGSWSDRKVLGFPANSAGAEFEVTFFNDTWHETLFLGGGNELENCVTGMNRETGSVGTYLSPAGREDAWMGNMQVGAEGSGLDTDLAHGAQVRVVVKGSELGTGGFILSGGDGVTVKFRASDVSSKSMRIKRAFIAEAANQLNPGPDIDVETLEPLKFGTAGSSQNGIHIGSGNIAETVPADFPLDPEKSYVISYWINNNNPDQGNPWHFRSEAVGEVSPTYTYLLPESTSPTLNDLRSATWSSKSNLQLIPGILGVESISTTYVNEGVFTSRIVDTTLSAPTYHDIDWEGDFPEGTSVAFQIRTGNEADLSDASEWEDVTEMYSPSMLNLSQKRYVQVRITLLRNRTTDEIPTLNNFTLRWVGKPSYVDFGGDFQKFSSGGTYEFFVNDVAPISTLRSELRLTSAGKTENDLADSWKLTVETTPRN